MYHGGKRSRREKDGRARVGTRARGSQELIKMVDELQWAEGKRKKKNGRRKRKRLE